MLIFCCADSRGWCGTCDERDGVHWW